MFRYISKDYIEEDYYEGDELAVTPLPAAPSRGMSKSVFIEAANTFLAALPQFASELDTIATAMTLFATNSTSTTSATIADTGSLTFTAEASKSYVPGMTLKVAATSDGTTWMMGDVTSYDVETGELAITMNAKQGSGTYAEWSISLSTPTALGGSLTQDFSVKSLTHAIGTAIASAATINLSTVTGNLVHVTGSNEIQAATMTAGKDVLVIFDGTPQLSYHSLNLRLNSGGANITVAAGDWALFTYDGSIVRVTLVRANGKAIVETAPPAGAPVGSGLIHFGSSAPANYLACPTAPTNLSRVTYSALFAQIGTTWGAGDGATTFGMPWFNEHYTMLQRSGTNVGSWTLGEVKAHTHNFNIYPTTGSGSVPSAGTSAGAAVANSTTSAGGPANVAAGHYVLICVKYQ